MAHLWAHAITTPSGDQTSIYCESSGVAKPCQVPLHVLPWHCIMLKGATDEKRLETLMILMCNTKRNDVAPWHVPKIPWILPCKTSTARSDDPNNFLQSAQRLLQKAPDVPAGGLHRLAIATIAASLELCSWSPSARWPQARFYNLRYALTALDSDESGPLWKLLGAFEAGQLGEGRVTQRHSHIDIDVSKQLQPNGAKGLTHITRMFVASWNIAMVENVWSFWLQVPWPEKIRIGLQNPNECQRC